MPSTRSAELVSLLFWPACHKNTHCNDLEADEAGNVEDIAPGHTKKESDWVEDVANNQLDGEVVIASETNVASPPGQQARNEVQQRNDDKQGCNDHAGDLDSQPGAVSNSFKHVGALVSLVLRHNNLASGEALLFFGVAEVAESEGGRNRHDAAGNKHLCVQTEVDVSDQDRASNGRKPTRHDLVNLGLGQVWHERLNQHSTFSLSDERSCSSDNCLSARDAHAPEEEDRELANEPLDDAPIVQHLHEGDEEDDSGDYTGEEPSELGNARVGQEGDTIAGVSKQTTRQERDEGEDVITNARPENEECDDELDELGRSVLPLFPKGISVSSKTYHAHDDSVPVDRLAVTRSSPHAENQKRQPEQTDTAVGKVIVSAGRAGKATNNDHSDCSKSTQRDAEFFRNHVHSS